MALGVLATCAVFVVCMVLPALNGPGLFLLPSTALLLVAAALGLYPALRETWQEVRGTFPSVKLAKESQRRQGTPRTDAERKFDSMDRSPPGCSQAHLEAWRH